MAEIHILGIYIPVDITTVMRLVIGAILIQHDGQTRDRGCVQYDEEDTEQYSSSGTAHANLQIIFSFLHYKNQKSL